MTRVNFHRFRKTPKENIKKNHFSIISGGNKNFAPGARWLVGGT